MICGIDISNNNKDYLVNKDIAKNAFIFLKASEGKTFKDKSFRDYIVKIAEESNTYGVYPFIGAYHFARPDNGNTPREELTNYLDAVGSHISNIMVALDYEDKAHAIGEKWALEYLRLAQKETGKPSFFYTSASYLSKYPTIAAEFPLWLACYSQDSREGKYKKECDKAVILQVTSNPLDIDIFRGNMIEMYQYCRG